MGHMRTLFPDGSYGALICTFAGISVPSTSITNDEQANAYNQLVIDGKIDPCLSDVYSFEDIGKAHHANRFQCTIANDCVPNFVFGRRQVTQVRDDAAAYRTIAMVH